jgi:hypothetical protein
LKVFTREKLDLVDLNVFGTKPIYTYPKSKGASWKTNLGKGHLLDLMGTTKVTSATHMPSRR